MQMQRTFFRRKKERTFFQKENSEPFSRRKAANVLSVAVECRTERMISIKIELRGELFGNNNGRLNLPSM